MEKTTEDYRIERENKVLDAIRDGNLSALVDTEGYQWDKDFLKTILSEFAYYTKEVARFEYTDIASDVCDALVDCHSFGKRDDEVD